MSEGVEQKPQQKNYECKTVEDAIMMLDAVDKFLDNYQRLRDKYIRATKKLERLFGVKEKKSVLRLSSGYGMDKMMKQMFENMVYDILRKQGLLKEEIEEIPEEEEIEEKEIEKFFTEEKPKEEEKNSME